MRCRERPSDLVLPYVIEQDSETRGQMYELFLFKSNIVFDIFNSWPKINK